MAVDLEESNETIIIEIIMAAITATSIIVTTINNMIIIKSKMHLQVSCPAGGLLASRDQLKGPVGAGTSTVTEVLLHSPS